MGGRTNAVVVIAGIPGAGKSTLIRRAVDRRTTRVVDTDDQRREGRRRPAIVRLALHYLRIVRAVLGAHPAVIHSRGTTTAARRAIALLARLRGRPAELILLVATEDEALAGQAARGRVVGAQATASHARRLARLAASDPRALAEREGWTSVRMLSRAEAARIERLAPATEVQTARLRGPWLPRARGVSVRLQQLGAETLWRPEPWACITLL